MSDKFKDSKVVRIDTTDYDLTNASKEAYILIEQIKHLETNILEKINIEAIYMRARNGYIEDLKSEILENKTGIDFKALLTEE